MNGRGGRRVAAATSAAAVVARRVALTLLQAVSDGEQMAAGGGSRRAARRSCAGNDGIPVIARVNYRRISSTATLDRIGTAGFSRKAGRSVRQRRRSRHVLLGSRCRRKRRRRRWSRLRWRVPAAGIAAQRT